MSKASEYTVKRIDENHFELWHDEQHLATLTKEEAWPVITGQIHPNTVISEHPSEEATITQERSNDE